eukprot:4935093-Pyramimonas_sp.AAC.1
MACARSAFVRGYGVLSSWCRLGGLDDSLGFAVLAALRRLCLCVDENCRPNIFMTTVLPLLVMGLVAVLLAVLQDEEVNVLLGTPT